ncbi:competence protein ComER [Caldalkalibacillus uzonensis]|uniref:Pyrroline-5-carboxylate reductase n=1 Tax=Caldalkalibacillus uzonensis TaxID=353224 RepID=A0ABU0CT36_9BACI|nr:late competence protein ComER [Caldalkalibacillus uzonensis]MDQ0339596.1 competence protein ComER [Caldalkalibacillus uzonensis]
MRVGFVGTGSMGSILIEALIESKALQPSQIHASNRTFDKVKTLAKKYTGLHAYPSNARVVQKADIVFLCVKPLEFQKVIDQIKHEVHEEHLIVSITSPVEIKDLERKLKAKVAKVIPSITNSVGQGASLIMAGERLTERDKDVLFHLMKSISHPLWLDEKYTRISSDIASCGPAFISFLLQRMIDAAVEETGIPRDKAVTLFTHMMIGFGELLNQNKFTLESLQERVCVPGGVTGVGIGVLDQEVNDMFHKLFKATQLKYNEDVELVQEMFYKTST